MTFATVQDVIDDLKAQDPGFEEFLSQRELETIVKEVAGETVFGVGEPELDEMVSLAIELCAEKRAALEY